MEPLEPTDLEIAELVRNDVKLFVESPDGFKQVSSNGPIVLMANSCAIVLTPITGEFAKKCKELHATGGLKPQDVRLGAFNASRYNAPGNKIMYYFRLSGVEIQVTIEPADSKLALDSVAEVVASLRLSESSAI